MDQSQDKYQILKQDFNTVRMKIVNEGDTLGNLIREQLLHSNNVTFAGYRKPHPLQNEIFLNVKTKDDVGVLEEINHASQQLIDELDHLQMSFEQQVKNTKFD